MKHVYILYRYSSEEAKILAAFSSAPTLAELMELQLPEKDYYEDLSEDEVLDLFEDCYFSDGETIFTIVKKEVRL